MNTETKSKEKKFNHRAHGEKKLKNREKRISDRIDPKPLTSFGFGAGRERSKKMVLL